MAGNDSTGAGGHSDRPIPPPDPGAPPPSGSAAKLAPEAKPFLKGNFWPVVAVGAVLVLLGYLPDLFGVSNQLRFVMAYGGLGIVLTAAGTNAKISNDFLSLTGAGAVVVIIAQLLPPEYDRAFIGHITANNESKGITLQLDTLFELPTLANKNGGYTFHGRESALENATHISVSITNPDTTVSILYCVPTYFIKDFVGQKRDIQWSIRRQDGSQFDPVTTTYKLQVDHNPKMQSTYVANDTTECAPVPTQFRRVLTGIGNIVGISSAHGQTLIMPQTWDRFLSDSADDQIIARRELASKMSSADVTKLIGMLADIPAPPLAANVRKVDNILAVLNSPFLSRKRDLSSLFGSLTPNQLQIVFKFTNDGPKQIWANATLFLANYASMNTQSRIQIIELVTNVFKQPLQENSQLNALALLNGLACQNIKRLRPDAAPYPAGIPDHTSDDLKALLAQIQTSGASQPQYPDSVKAFAEKLYNGGSWQCVRW